MESPALPGDLCRSSPPCEDCGGPLASALLLLQTLGPLLNCQGPWQNPSGDEKRWKKVRATMFLTRTLPLLVPLLGSYLCVPEGQERDEGGGRLGIYRQRVKVTEVVALGLRDQSGWRLSFHLSKIQVWHTAVFSECRVIGGPVWEEQISLL